MAITGWKPGPRVGEVLKDLFVRVIDGELPADRCHLLMVMEVEHERETLPFP
jgi:hypothetical protein